MTDYMAYGLRIRSDHVLHFAPVDSTQQSDVLVMQWCGELWSFPKDDVIHRMPDYPGGPVLLVWVDDDAFCIDYAGWQARFVPGSGHMEIAPVRPVVDAAHVAERVWVPFYAMCSFEDVLALHGSAVGINGSAHVILGQSGAGKSTTALACVAQGAALLSDDMVLVNVTKRQVYPAAPTLRLWHPPAPGVEVIEDALISPASEKRWYKVATSSQGQMPLARVVMLERSSEASVYGELEQLKGMEAMLALLRNAFDWEHPPEWWARARLKRARKLLSLCPFERLRFSPDPEGRPLHTPKVIS